MMGASHIKEDRFLNAYPPRPFADFLNICKMNSKRRIFSHQEKSLLINIVKNYKVIEEKKKDDVSLKKKEVFGERNSTIIQQPRHQS